MSRNVALLLLTLFAYTLVLVHGIVPHQHLHHAGKQAEAHTHDGHGHAHSHDEPAEQKEHPFSHYFHSAVQGEPHVSARYTTLPAAPQADIVNSKLLREPDALTASYVQGRALYATGFLPPPHPPSLPQRGPPSA